MAPFLLESAQPTTRDHRPVSFLHVNELFSHLLKEEKQHSRGRPVLGHTITAICIPSAAGLAQECALQLCGGKRSLGRKEWGGFLPGLSIPSSMIHFHLCESQRVEITPARLSKEGKVERAREGERAREAGGRGLRVLGELPPLVL